MPVWAWGSNRDNPLDNDNGLGSGHAILRAVDRVTVRALTVHCGGSAVDTVHLVSRERPGGNAEALAWGIRSAVASGPLPPAARRHAGTRFTVEQSVNTLLAVLARPQAIPPATIVGQLEELIVAPAADQPHARSVWLAPTR